MTSKKRLILSVAAIIVMFFLALVFLPKMVGSAGMAEDIFDDSIFVEFHHTDGTVEEYHGKNFPAPSRGEILLIKVPMQEQYRVDSGILSFMFYHAAVEVSYNGKLLYQYGQDLYENNQFIGSVYVQTAIPDDAWGNEITITLTASEGGSEIGLDDITVVPAEKGYIYYILGHETLFAVFFALIIFSFALMFTLICNGGFASSQKRIGIYASAFSLCLSLWMFSYYGLNRLMISNMRVCADMEYILLYYSPVAITLYMCEIERTKREKMIYAIVAAFYFAAATIGMILNYATPIHFSRTLIFFHIFILLGCTYILWSLFSDRRDTNINKVSVRYGMTIIVIAIVIDLVRFSIKHYSMLDAPILYISIVPVGIVMFVATIVYGFLQNMLAGEINRKERENLTAMAYTDSMTGLFNRARYGVEIEELKENGIVEYAIIFFDLNYLKRANDLYGHNMGDAYIKEVSLIIRNTFGRDAFCGRLGGDEFIAILRGTRSKMVSNYLREFDEAIQKLDESKTYPFKIAVPHGTAVSSKRRIIAVDEAVRLADERMYDAKQKSKNGAHEDGDHYHDDREDE